MIKAVAFDLWETLITNTAEISRAQKQLRLERLARVLGDAGFGATADRLDQAHHQSWDRCQELYWSRDEDVPCRRQIEILLEALDLGRSLDDATLDALEDAYARVAVDVLPALVDGARDVAESLKGRGLRLGLISNTGRTPGYALREILERIGLARSFDAMVFSNEHGVCKPQPSIFETLRAALGVACEEMMFVGDNLYVDVHGAQRCGMVAVHFAPPRRGTAVAPSVEHDLEIVPHATISDLRELPEIVRTLTVGRASARR